MHFLKLSLFALPLATGSLATSIRHQNPRPKPSKLHHPQKKTSSYRGPGTYYIENKATGTTMDLYNGDAGPDTDITGYAATKNNAHQIWNVVAARQHHQVLIINSATGAIASCSSETNDEGVYELKGGEVAIDGYSLFTLKFNKDKSVSFQNVNDSDFCLDLQYSSNEDGTPIICYPCHKEGGGENQNWNLVPVSKVVDEETGSGELKV